MKRKLLEAVLGLSVAVSVCGGGNGDFVGEIGNSKYVERVEKRMDGEDYLVHIKQIHFSPILVVLNDERLVREIRKEQGNIYKLVLEIEEKGFARHVYSEGVTLENISSVFGLLKQEKEFYDVEFPKTANSGPVDAIEWLYNKNNFPVYPAELSYKLKLAADSKLKKYVYDLREDEVLNFIERDRSKYRVVIFGAKHDFLDNVKKWNRKHKEKLGLIDLYPKGIFKIRGTSKKVEERFFRRRGRKLQLK